MSQENYSTLWEHLTCIADPRSPRGQQHDWTFIVTLIGAAMLAGQKSMQAMSQWVNMNSKVFIECLNPRRKRVPSYATLRRALCDMDIEAFEGHLAAYSQGVDEDDSQRGCIETQEGGVLRGQSVDGKTLRGASAHGDKVHLVSLVRHESAAVLGQIATEAGIDEPKVAKVLLTQLLLANTATTMDALYTERSLTKQILAAGGEYLMVVKANQRTLHQEIELAFTALPPTSSWEEEFWDYDVHTTQESQRGRTEVRQLERTTALNDYLNWPGVGQVMRRTYRRVEHRTGAVSQEVHYGITSLSPAQVSLSQLAQLWRWHWTIENSTHYIRDVSLGEDRCQIRSGNAPQALAALRNAIITALRYEGWAYVPNALRRFAHSPQDALRFMGAIAT